VNVEVDQQAGGQALETQVGHELGGMKGQELSTAEAGAAGTYPSSIARSYLPFHPRILESAHARVSFRATSVNSVSPW